MNNVRNDGGAWQAGIREGDVILSIDGKPMNSGAQMQEYLTKFRPGDRVKVTVRRESREREYEVVLRNIQGNTDVVRHSEVLEVLGATFEPLSERELRALGVRNGVRVESLKTGKLSKVGIREGFVVTNVNKKPVNSVEDITNILQETEGGVIIEGLERNGTRSYYAFGM